MRSLGFLLLALPLWLTSCASTEEARKQDSAPKANQNSKEVPGKSRPPAKTKATAPQEAEPTPFTDDRPIPLPTDEERREFDRIWEMYRRDDPRWQIERDRFKRRSDAAGYLLAGHLLRHYMQLNAARDRAARDLIRVKNEVVEVGEPCAAPLVDLMVLESIERPDGTRFIVDDLTRQDCLDMLERLGPPAVPAMLRVLARTDLGDKGRRHVALALGGTKDGRALDPLVRMLSKDPSWQVRADAASALGKLGDRRALPALQEAVRSDPDRAVVSRAGKARQQILEAAARG